MKIRYTISEHGAWIASKKSKKEIRCMIEAQGKHNAYSNSICALEIPGIVIIDFVLMRKYVDVNPCRLSTKKTKIIK